MSPEQDTIWQTIRREAEEGARNEPVLASFLHSTILNHETLERALAYHLANKLADANLQPIGLMELFIKAYDSDSEISRKMRIDIQAVFDRDAACRGYSMPLLYFKGFHALQSYRLGHWLWENGRQEMAVALQSRISEAFGVDIHPAARIGCGVLMDHATSVVIGETAVVGDHVSILHSVTLGGTGKEDGDRHPKVGNWVLIGAGAILLGNIKIGTGAKIGASSVVLEDVPEHCVVAGVPAVIIGHPTCDQPSLEMNHRLNPDIEDHVD